ncbi:heterokaryon incompatibility protein-domain-containing protein, partial [Apiospora saccharicola]
MRLINVHTGYLEEFIGDQIPDYAILSHTWGAEEVTFEDWKKDQATYRGKRGFKKIINAWQQAKHDRLNYLWCDTNCIDKSSSADLTEAINSMFAWYRDAKVCYAYLEDVFTDAVTDDLRGDMPSSRWFTRGWTLQELLAPHHIQFFNAYWILLGDISIGHAVHNLAPSISSVTGIGEDYLCGRALSNASVAQRMSWVSRRTTTRVEDMAYCMLGIFDINMPLLYGEGRKAFERLQQEIIKNSNDHTIFCWKRIPGIVPETWRSLLAPSHEVFRESGNIRMCREDVFDDEEVSTYSMTNAGLSIKLPFRQASSYRLVMLDAAGPKSGQRLAVPLRILPGRRLYVRCEFPPFPIPIPASFSRPMSFSKSRESNLQQFL